MYMGSIQFRFTSLISNSRTGLPNNKHTDAETPALMDEIYDTEASVGKKLVTLGLEVLKLAKLGSPWNSSCRIVQILTNIQCVTDKSQLGQTNARRSRDGDNLVALAKTEGIITSYFDTGFIFHQLQNPTVVRAYPACRQESSLTRLKVYEKEWPSTAILSSIASIMSLSHLTLIFGYDNDAADEQVDVTELDARLLFSCEALATLTMSYLDDVDDEIYEVLMSRIHAVSDFYDID
ncbi:hypothetical protein BJV82DRAFT_663618 [Fennellomyces sp. T-0311]|nr:hypothetical protein BJV82DRAFT_663618 [Fennellomyces sp. T-0311]